MKIEWDSLFAYPAIRRLMQLAQRSFGVRVNFIDARGWLQGVEAGRFFNPIGELLSTLSASESGFRVKRDAAFRLASGASQVRIPKRLVTEAGTAIVAVPLVVDHQYCGYVFADDFFEADRQEEQKVAFRNFYQRKIADLPDLQARMSEIPVLTASDVTYLIDILEAVAEELTGACSDSVVSASGGKNDGLLSIPGFTNNYIIGTSALVRDLLTMLARIAGSDATVLVTGESGVGKELVAKTLHENSRRAKKNFIAVNCGAFHEQLLESELFGHVKGAFTGATETRAGYFEQAHGGTLFLDEMGETSLSMQVKMLRFLQEGTFIPVGDAKEKSSDVRIVAATNRDLKQMMKMGAFREDLYYRLRVIHIHIPSLRERREDIPLLVAYFVKKHADGNELPVSDDTMDYLTGYHWPGNIRQLENEVKRLCVLSKGEREIRPDVLSDDIVAARRSRREFGKVNESLQKTLDEREKTAIIEGLARTAGNKTRLARDLGMSRSLLAAKIKKYGIAS